MASGLESVWNSAGFIPHGVCLLWQPEILALHISSDVLIGLSYYSIPLTLLYFVHRRRDVAFGWIALLFALFIVACGTTHFMNIWTLWEPDYVLEGVVKGFTAFVSLLTAATLWVLMPKLLALPSPRQLEQANAALQHEIDVRRMAELRYAGFFNNLAEALFIVEVKPDGRFVFDALNPAHVRVTGLDPEQIAGREVSQALPPEISQSVLARYRECLEVGHAIDYEETHEVPVGRRVFHTVLVPVRNPDGRIVQLLGSSRDITDRKRFQEEIVQTSKLATLGTLAAGMAHEMSQPLNIIRLWAENAVIRLRDELIDRNRVEKALTLIVDQTDRMGQLIDHIRTFGRSDGGGQGNFNPGQSVRRAIQLIENQFALEEITVAAANLDSVFEVRGRPLHLEQVVLNLLSNARDAIASRRAAGQRAGRIEVALREDPARDSVTITVTDDGGGVDPGILTRIFDPFFTTKEVGKGTGLGLSVGYGMIEAMNGRIEAANVTAGDERRGLRVSVTLPAYRSPSLGQELAHA